MDIFLNFGLAWISILLVLLTSIIYIMRVILKSRKSKHNNKSSLLKTINKKLRKHHKFIGIILIITGVLHGYFSSQEVLSSNLGTVSWVLSILLGLSFMFRKSFGKWKGWMFYHRLLTVSFILMIVFHVVQVGGIHVFDYLGSSSNTSISSSTAITNKLGVTTTGSNYKDGTYTSVASGFQPGMKVSVTIKNDKITDIKIISSNDSSSYLNRAKSIINDIINKQSTNVDSVSGATYSSKGIKDAVNAALSQALVN